MLFGQLELTQLLIRLTDSVLQIGVTRIDSHQLLEFLQIVDRVRRVHRRGVGGNPKVR